MIRFCLLTLTLLAVFTANAQEEEYTPPEVIYNQPAGELRLFERQGAEVVEDEEGATFEVRQQTGFMSIVFGNNHDVYLQDPVSGYTMPGSWVKGTINDERTAVTVPLGQYVDYTYSFDMAYQMMVLDYDAEKNTYVIDSTATAVSYTINEQGEVRLEGMSQQRILGLILRTFGHPQGSAIGQDFSYLNGEWLGFGDFASVYTPSNLNALQPPTDLVLQSYYLTTAKFNGAEYLPYSGTVRVGIEADATTVWLQGISEYLPSAWVKGTVDGARVTIPTGTFLGTVEGIPLYLHGASLTADNSFYIKDIQLDVEDGTYVTYDFVFLTTSATALDYVNFYMGATFSLQPDAPVVAPEGLQTAGYTMSYRDESSLKCTEDVEVGFADGCVYVKGLWNELPSAWLKGAVNGRQVVFDMPQFLGNYTSNSIDYPMYAAAFDGKTEQMLPQLTFDFDPAELSLTSASSPLCIGINKTGYLSVQDFFSLVFEPKEKQGIAGVTAARAQHHRVFNLNGQRSAQPVGGLYIVDGRKVVRR